MSFWSFLGKLFGGGASTSTPDWCGAAVVVKDEHGRPVVGARVWVGWASGLTGGPGVYQRQGMTNDDGYVAFGGLPRSAAGRVVPVFVHVTQADYVAYPQAPDQGRYVLYAANQDLPVTCARAHVDPSAFSLSQLSATRGSMWSTSCNLPGGPRPNRDDNILATDFWSNYDAEQRNRAAATLRRDGFTHVAVGPLVDSDGYHGLWSPSNWLESQASWDRFLDILQDFWDRGFCPIVFGKPDAWTFEEFMTRAEPFLRQPRAQRLIRYFVPAGWEPTRYKFSSWSYAALGAWARTVLPNAIIALHQEADCDAPVGNDEKGNDTDNAAGWARVAPFFHIWLVQTGAFEYVSTNPHAFADFCDLFRESNPKSYTNRFRNGYAGWPMFSAWGPSSPILVVAAEYAAYWRLWDNRSQAEAYAWGDGAMAAGADGYLDGGTVAVPVRR